MPWTTYYYCGNSAFLKGKKTVLVNCMNGLAIDFKYMKNVKILLRQNTFIVLKLCDTTVSYGMGSFN